MFFLSDESSVLRSKTISREYGEFLLDFVDTRTFPLSRRDPHPDKLPSIDRRREERGGASEVRVVLLIVFFLPRDSHIDMK